MRPFRRRRGKRRDRLGDQLAAGASASGCQGSADFGRDGYGRPGALKNGTILRRGYAGVENCRIGRPVLPKSPNGDSERWLLEGRHHGTPRRPAYQRSLSAVRGATCTSARLFCDRSQAPGHHQRQDGTAADIADSAVLIAALLRVWQLRDTSCPAGNTRTRTPGA